MNEIVAKFIEEQKKKQKEIRIKEKDKHLIELGLVDDSGLSKQDCPPNLLDWQRKEYGFIYQDESGYFKYNGNVVPLNISDEDYEEICKVCPPDINKKKTIPILSIVSLAVCVALTIVCVFLGIKIGKMNDQITETKTAISNYAEEPIFSMGESNYTLLGILNLYGQKIDDLYNGQRQIRYNQSNLQNDLDRSNRFLNDYNSSRLFDDDWPMKQHY